MQEVNRLWRPIITYHNQKETLQKLISIHLITPFACWVNMSYTPTTATHSNEDKTRKITRQVTENTIEILQSRRKETLVPWSPEVWETGDDTYL